MENNTWKTYKLGEVTTKIGSGSTPTGGSNAYKDEGISLIRSQNILDFTFSKDGLAFIDDEQAFKLRGVTVEENDILFNITGDSVARVCKVPNEILPARVNQHVAILRADNINLNYDYLLYLLQSRKEELLIMSEIGATRNAITKVMLETLEIQLPPLPEQKAIASVLSSLDDKIDLLHQQNQTLEALAETLFRQWFIEEAKEDWEDIKFGEVVTVKRGGSPRPIQDYLSDSGYRWLKISDATKEDSPFIFDIKEHIKVEGLNKTTYLEAGKLVLSNSATPGLPKILQVDTCVHDGWLHFPKSKFSNEFMYLFFKKIRPELENMGNGSIFTNLKTDILKGFELKLPDDVTLQRFDIIIKDYFNKILINQQQIQTLTKLRDTLLPKLMSGEVRVKM
ncbi:restriction endonuclease subunit S [Empedobacter falsenii]